MEPDIISKAKLIKITDKDSGYVLLMDDGKSPIFNCPSPIYEKYYFAVTSRALSEYYMKHPFNPNPEKQYCEVGPGLGEYIPFLVKQFEKYSHSIKPLAIDLVNYDILLEMMNFAVDEGLTPSTEMEKELFTLIERAKIITNPKKVRLINKPLGQALEDYPESLGSVDELMDNMAAVFHSHISEGRKMQEMELLRDSLLKLELRAYN